MEEIVERLRQVSLFGRLRTRDLGRLANLFDRKEYDQDSYLTRQGEIGDRFFLLLKGRATIWRVESSGEERPVGYLRAGDSFGLTSLFLKEARDATVYVGKNSTVLSLERSRFQEFLQDFPAIRDALVVPEPLQERLVARRFKWMTEDEVTIFHATKSRWALVAGLMLPAVVFLGLMMVATLVQGVPYLFTVLAGLAVLLGGGWALLQWQDWRNDYYVVTNQRIVHHESHLPSLQVTVDQAPLHQIQNVNMLKPGPVAQWLNFGTLDIQTAGRDGAISFAFLDNPEYGQQVIFDLLEKQRSLAKMSERSAIREAITQRVRPQPVDTDGTEESAEEESSATLFVSGEAVWDLGEEEPPRAKESPKDSDTAIRLGSRLFALLPHFRQEQGGVVTWHKHPFVLIKAIAIPSLILLATLLVGVFWATFSWPSFGTVVLILFVVWCLGLFWFLWRYEDWRNEIFQMTGSHIVDIDRLPLGFRESRRQAALEQIQNINVDIPNIWARLFNYGNVVIETAGAAGDLTFEWVMRPRSVQAEIFKHIEELRARQRAKESEERRTEMAEWFAVYHQMKEREEI